MNKRAALVAVAVLLALGAGFVGGWLVHQPMPPAPTAVLPFPSTSTRSPVGDHVIVPDVSGGSVRHADFVLGLLGLRGYPLGGPCETHMTNIVAAERPFPGTSVVVGTAVTLSVRNVC